MGAVSPEEKELFAQRPNWQALHQVAEFRALGEAVALERWKAAGSPEITGEWLMRASKDAARIMNGSIAHHGAPPDLFDLAQAERAGKLDQVIAEANARFAASKGKS